LNSIYSAMHRGITAHAVDIDADNVGALTSMSFVFVCVDGGGRKGVIVRALEDAGVPFVDTGIGVELVDEQLLGMVRVTTSTPEKRDHLRDRVSFVDPAADAAYRSNIQIADLNALNAALAVIKWKKLRGLYVDLDREHHANYVISGNTMINDHKQ
jgi:acyl-CoA hydrolase